MNNAYYCSTLRLHMILFIPPNRYYPHFIGEEIKVQRMPGMRSVVASAKASVLNPVLSACLMH